MSDRFTPSRRLAPARRATVGDVSDRAATQFDPGTALIVVDMQNDFADPAGSLFVAGGETLVEPINALMRAARSAGATVVLTQDWHPPVTLHFQPEGPWPVHCVGGSWGAELVGGLDRHADAVVRKGTHGEDGYSAFSMRDTDTGHDKPTGLAGLLRERGIVRVVVVGLAGDVCVSATAQDAAAVGFATSVVWEATRAVSPDAAPKVRADLAAAGVTVVDR
jgi:nicotinamidase/pyrazinamidase